MAIFIAKAMVAPAGGSAVPITYGPDPVTGLLVLVRRRRARASTSPTSSTSDTYCKHAHYLWAHGSHRRLLGESVLPDLDIGRDEMSKFLTNAFRLFSTGPERRPAARGAPAVG